MWRGQEERRSAVQCTASWRACPRKIGPHSSSELSTGPPLPSSCLPGANLGGRRDPHPGDVLIFSARLKSQLLNYVQNIFGKYLCIALWIILFNPQVKFPHCYVIHRGNLYIIIPALAGISSSARPHGRKCVDEGIGFPTNHVLLEVYRNLVRGKVL